TRTVQLRNNTISNNGLPGTIEYEYMAGIWLQTNVASDPTSEISGNKISGNKLAGIFMFGETHGISVVGNTVSGTLVDKLGGNPVGDGIGLVGGASAHLTDNIVSSSGRFGIMVEPAPVAMAMTAISGNTIQDSAAYGVVLQGDIVIATDGNTFSGNLS